MLLITDRREGQERAELQAQAARKIEQPKRKKLTKREETAVQAVTPYAAAVIAEQNARWSDNA